MNEVGIGWVGLGWVGWGWGGLGWGWCGLVGSGWVGLGWVESGRDTWRTSRPSGWAPALYRNRGTCANAARFIATTLVRFGWGCVKLCCVVLVWFRLGWVGLGWVGFRVGMVFLGLDWVE